MSRRKPVFYLNAPAGLPGALTLAGFIVVALYSGATAQEAQKPIVYPHSAKGSAADVYHGVRVPDPYRWLEDPDSPESRAWIEAQNKVTFGFLEQIPGRADLRERLTRLWNYERFDVPFKRGERYFYTRNDGLQNQSVLYTVDALDGSPRILLDPNALSADGTVSLAGIAVSHDGVHLAYGISASGSDWMEWKVRRVATGEDLPDHLRWVKFSGASWTRDGKGFFYSRYDEPNEATRLEAVNYYQKLYFHRLGTPQAEDVLVYERPDEKEWGFSGEVSEDGDYLIISVWQGTDRRNRVFYKDLTAEKGNVVELVSQLEAAYTFIGNEGPLFWFLTDLKAPRGRIIAVDVRRPGREAWKEIVPQARETLGEVSLVGGRFIASYLKDARTQVKVFHTGGEFERELALPGIGTAGGFTGKKNHSESFYFFTGFTTAVTIYRYDISSGASSVFRRPKVAFDPGDYETRQVFYASKDGTRIPMFVTHRKGIQLDGNNPVYLYGYGGFNISVTPSFSVSNLVWMDLGGVYAVPNLRGGGEYGEDWHMAGTKLRKQNVFDDFVAAAEWLIQNRYTRSGRLAIGGASNGGLLVGACVNQRPELFGAALPAVGVMDMLRFHKFTIGWAWVSDYGSVDDPEEFKALYAYSPLHNLKPGTSYPATLITTADHDDRVVPAHSFKYAAALQAAHVGKAPVLIRIETKAGHGAGKATSKLIEEAADRWAFLVRVLEMEKR